GEHEPRISRLVVRRSRTFPFFRTGVVPTHKDGTCRGKRCHGGVERGAATRTCRRPGTGRALRDLKSAGYCVPTWIKALRPLDVLPMPALAGRGADHREAERFIRMFHAENPKAGGLAARLRDVAREIAR